MNRFFVFVVVFSSILLTLAGCKKEKTFVVEFNANGGEGTMESQIFIEGEEKALSANQFSREGYKFDCWNTRADGLGTYYGNREKLSVSSDMVMYAQWVEIDNEPWYVPPAPGDLNGHPYLDLALPSGTKWATCNIGATSPTGYGDYYAWGETTTKTTYNWVTYRYCNGNDTSITKYCFNSDDGNNGFVDNISTLEPSDDAATVNWGAGWRMPTKAEIQELKDNCTVVQETKNGVKGWRFIAKNANEIFIPFAGYKQNDDLLKTGTKGYYWTSSVGTDFSYYSYVIELDALGVYKMAYDRAYGFTIRPVCNPSQE